MGHRKAVFDLEKVEKLASRGLTQEQIAWSFGYAPSTLSMQKKKSIELDEAIKRGRAKGIAVMANALFDQGVAGNTASAIFWLKNNAGWTDRQSMEVSGPHGGPVSVVSSKPLSLEEWQKAHSE